jgi:hypothetical protein
MKKIIKSFITFLTAIVGFIGGLIWYFKFNGQAEALILIIISSFEILSYVFIPDDEEIKLEGSNTQNSNTQNLNLNLNFSDISKEKEIKNNPNESHNTKSDRNTIIEYMKSSLKVLFIDDDKNFNVVKILKDSGWKNTKTTIDIKSLDLNNVKESEIIFVDINGVGILLNLPYEGLDLSLMLKQRYPQKKIIIYSANKNSNSFHDAWDLCDYKLEKNALPYQFQNLVEEYSIELYNSKK